MTLLEKFGPRVEEFITDLYSFATGSYLRDSEKELWEPPFDPAASGEVRHILVEYLELVDNSDPEDQEAFISSAVHDAIIQLRQLNERYMGAVIEPEEIEFLSTFFYETVESYTGNEELAQNLSQIEEDLEQ